MNCMPRVTEDGKYAAQVEVTKVGFSREAAFRVLGEFDTEAEAVTVRRSFRKSGLIGMVDPRDTEESCAFTPRKCRTTL